MAGFAEGLAVVGVVGLASGFDVVDVVGFYVSVSPVALVSACLALVVVPFEDLGAPVFVLGGVEGAVGVVPCHVLGCPCGFGLVASRYRLWKASAGSCRYLRS